MFIMVYLKIIQKEGERERQKREQCIHFSHINPLNIYLFRVNNRKTKKRCHICLCFPRDFPCVKHRCVNIG